MKRHCSSIIRSGIVVAAILAASTTNANAETPICASSLQDGAFSASYEIGEFYPGSELHRQTIMMQAIPVQLPVAPHSIKTPLPRYSAVLELVSKSSLQDKVILKQGQYENLGFTLTIPLLESKMWYHKNCLVETENYVLYKNGQMEGDYTNHCDIPIRDFKSSVLQTETNLDYTFSGHDHWQLMTLRFDLAKMRAFQENLDQKSAQQLADYAAGKCNVKPFK